MKFFSWFRFTGFLLVLSFFAVPAMVLGQAVKEVKAEIKAVTVFLNHAQINSSARTNVTAGQTELALTNIPGAIDVNSIQVEAQGRVTIYGVRFDHDYLLRNQKPRELTVAEDSLNFYVNSVRALTDQIEVYRIEEGMVRANQSIGGQQKGVSVDDLEEVADFFRQRLTAIRANIQKAENRLVRVNENVQRFQKQVQNLGGRNQPANGRILVTVSAEANTPVGLDISYVVHNAGWQPVYDLRVADTRNPVKLQYKANVFQNTGVNWNNVKLTLTTNNPTIGAAKPELQPWYLSIYAPQPRAQQLSEVSVTADESRRPRAKGGRQESAQSYAAPPLEPARDLSSEVSVAQSGVAVEFKINVPYSVPADGKKHLVDIQQYEMKSSYAYSAVPKLAPEAFLMAHVMGWEDFNILPGEANVFLDGTFTGKTFLNPQNTGDTLSFSLGRDKKVVLTRDKVKELKSKGFLGNNVKETRGYQITVRNTKDQAIDLTLEDQIPVSNNSQIEVELLEAGGGTLDKTTGKITWQLKLNPNETKKIPLRFEVKYPKNQRVAGL